MNVILRLAKQQQVSAPAMGLLVYIYLTPRFRKLDRLTGPEANEMAKLKRAAYRSVYRELRDLAIPLVDLQETTGAKNSNVHVNFRQLDSVEVEGLKKYLEDGED